MSERADTSTAMKSKLSHPVQTMTEAVNHVPGAPVVKGVVDGVLDTVGLVSPHARRVAAYAGVGLLGVAGLVEWPVAAAGAAVVWLTQPRPEHNGGATTAQRTAERAVARPKAKARAKATPERTPAKRTASKTRTTAKKSAPKRTASATRTRRTTSSATSRQKS